MQGQRQIVLDLIVSIDTGRLRIDSIRTVSRLCTERQCQETEYGPSGTPAAAETDQVDLEALRANQQFWEEERTFDGLLDALVGFLQKSAVSTVSSEVFLIARG
jgi:hypothetical protein